MKYKLVQLFVIIELIKISSFDSPEYDFGKYGTAITKNYCVIFNPTGFQNGETMYFKISAKEFKDNFLYYEYLDDLENYEFNFNLKKLHEVKAYYKYEPDEDSENDDEEIHYFKIVKNKEDLGNLEGKYLLLYCNFEGTAEIKNTEKDEGKRSKIYSIVFSIIAVVAIALVAYFCFFRKKCKKDNEKNDINVPQNKNNEQTNQNAENNNQNINNQIKNNQNMNLNNMKLKNNINQYNNNNNNSPPLANNNDDLRDNNTFDCQFQGDGKIEYNPNNNINNIPASQYTENKGFEQNPNFNQYNNIPKNSIENNPGYTSNCNLNDNVINQN